MQDLKNRVILVTGGATGLGLGISRALADSGARVAVLQISLEQAKAGAAAIPNAMGFAADVRSPEQVEEAVSAVVDAMGGIDGLVNNAAVTGPLALGSLLTMSAAQVRTIVDTNLNGSIWCAQSVARQILLQKSGGAIVNIASVGAFAAQDKAAVYCATKGAQVTLTKAMALEFAGHNIRVNAVAPGDIQTETNAEIVNDMKASGVDMSYLRMTPLRRRGTPAEVGAAVAFLLSDAASFITGETLAVDGGFLTY